MAPNSTTDKKFQFNYSDRSGKTVGFRLNTDIELVFNIDVSATAGTTCTFAGPKPPTCPVSDTISWVKLYASVSGFYRTLCTSPCLFFDKEFFG